MRRRRAPTPEQIFSVQVEFARAIDPTAWAWIDKVCEDENEHPALFSVVKHQLVQAQRVINVVRQRSAPARKAWKTRVRSLAR